MNVFVFCLLDALADGAEEEAMRTVCQTEMQISLQLPDDFERFRDDVADFVNLWNECLRIWLARKSVTSYEYETNLTEENNKRVRGDNL